MDETVSFRQDVLMVSQDRESYFDRAPYHVWIFLMVLDMVRHVRILKRKIGGLVRGSLKFRLSLGNFIFWMNDTEFRRLNNPVW